MKNPTIRTLAKLYSVDECTVAVWRDNGVDIYDPAAVELYRSTLDGGNLSKDDFLDDIDEVDKQGFIKLKFQKLKHETSLKEAESALKNLELDKKKSELVPINEVCETNMLIASKTKAQLKALQLSLPPKLDGLSVKEMSKLIGEEINTILGYLYGELNIDDEQ